MTQALIETSDPHRDVTHNTVVDKGHVHMAGPFYLSSLGFTNMITEGETCESDADSTNGQCVPNDKRLLVEAQERAVKSLRGYANK